MIEYFQTLNDPVVILGLVASLVVLISMCFSTRTFRGTFLMRVINLIASILCVVYGYMLGAQGLGTFLLNLILVGVNLFHIVTLIMTLPKLKK